MRVLVIEDEPEQLDSIRVWLRAAGFVVDAVADVPEADYELAVNSYDCAVFDRRLPSGDSLEYVRGRRAAGWTVPVLFLTASASISEVVEGLDVGDDYLTKPFQMAELEARVRRLCPYAVPGPPPILRCGDLELDPGRREVHRAGALLSLTGKEFGVLELLLARYPEPVTTKELIKRFWDEVRPDPNALQQCILGLRRKLHDPKLVRNVRGVGYRFVPAA